MRTAEAKLRAWELAQGGDVGEVYNRSPNLWRVQREIRALESCYEKTLRWKGDKRRPNGNGKRKTRLSEVR